MVIGIPGILQDANETAEKIGEAAGTVVGVLLFIALIVWAIKKYGKS